MSSASRVRVVPDEVVARIMSLGEVIDLIERAFADDARGVHRNFGVVRERLAPAHDGIFGIKSGLAGNTLGLKAGGFWLGNRARGIPPHQSTMVLFDPDTGCPTAFVGANRITGLRTGAAGAVAARHLARDNAGRVALIGCGAQGTMQLRALALSRTLTSVQLWDANRDAAVALRDAFAAESGVPVEIGADPESMVRTAEIVVTATPASGPVVMADWAAPGQHITAVGADTAGKRELDTPLLLRSRLVVDNRQQALTLGETQHLRGLVDDPEAEIAAELGEVVAGSARGRQSDEDITIFDATGVTFQDLVVAAEIVRRAEEANEGMVIDF